MGKNKIYCVKNGVKIVEISCNQLKSVQSALDSKGLLTSDKSEEFE